MTETHDAISYGLLAVFSSVLFVLGLGGDVHAQSQGLKLRLASQDGTKTDVRRARTVSLYVQEGEPVSSFLPAGPFKATWKGALTFDDFGMDVTISARGRGTLHVSVNGQKAFDSKLKGRTRVKGKTVGIQNGKNPLKVTYESPEQGASWVRLYWSSSDFYPEPLPVDQLVHTRSERMKRKQKRRTGRSLFLNHRCAKCHQDTEAHSPDPRSEWNMDAPDLSGAGTAFHTNWMARWMADPTRYRKDASMPATLHGDQQTVRSQAQDIAAYLATRTDDDRSGPKVTRSKEQVKKGKKHFRRLGCVSCHTVRESQEKKQGGDSSMDRVSLAYVAEKWKSDALAGYLMNPRTHYRWNPMPDFRLDQNEAQSLAAYLIEKTRNEKESDAGEGTEGDAKRGKKLIAKKGCHRCHGGTGVKDGYENEVPSLSALFSSGQKSDRHGCLAENGDRRGAVPDFAFTERERNALAAFLSSKRAESLSRFVPAEFATRQVDRLNCASCHRYDGEESVWSRLPDEQTDVKLDSDQTHGVKQLRPPLTWVGDMLQYDWMKDTISGELEEKARPWLAARMPGFGPYSAGLARGLAAQHGYPPKRITYSSDSRKRARKGKKIVESLNCYSCHGAGDREPNTFEVAGINFVKSGRRLHRDFAIRWTLAPGRMRSDTGMPAFFQWGEPSPLSGILDGDLRKQMKAIWQYLRHAEELESN